MAVECVKHNVPTAVVPITYLPRPSGSDTNLRPFRDGGIIFLELYRRAKTNNPLFYFGSVGTVALLAGLLFGAYVGYDWFVNDISHEVIAIVAAFSLIFGVQLLIFGVISDMLLTLHRERMRRLDDIESLVASWTPGGVESGREGRRTAGNEKRERGVTDGEGESDG